MAKQTSRAAYEALVASGKAESQRARILKRIVECLAGCTRQELVRYTGIPINAVCGRVAELLKAGHIRVGTYTVECQVTGQQVECLYRVI